MSHQSKESKEFMKTKYETNEKSWHPQHSLLSTIPSVKMIKLLALLIMFILISAALQAQSNINISGENNAIYTHRTEKNTFSNHFENEFKLRLDNRIFSFGMTFNAELPKFDKVTPDHMEKTEKINAKWVDRYAQLTFDNFWIKAGTIEEAFGSGIVLRAWNDKENDNDRRLEGAQTSFMIDKFRFSGVYGLLKEYQKNFVLHEKDLVIGGDIDYKPFPYLNVGVSAVEYKQERKDFWGNFDFYTHFNVYGGRLGLLYNFFDIKAEYAEIRRFHLIPDSSVGSAIYSIGNVYLGPVTLSGGYKRYSRFHYYESEEYIVYEYALADMPTLNHYDQLLSTWAPTDFEEGLMGEIRYIPNFDNEFLLNYSESWDKNDYVYFKNLYTEYKRNFKNFAVNVDFEYMNINVEIHYPELDFSSESDDTEIKPSVSIDFYSFSIPFGLSMSWSYNEEYLKSYGEYTRYYNKPRVQIESRVHEKLSVAVFAENEFEKYTDIAKSKLYVGTEIVTSISSHTDVRLFVGKEQGGKVCRNGTCLTQPPFEGVRLSLNTRF